MCNNCLAFFFDQYFIGSVDNENSEPLDVVIHACNLKTGIRVEAEMRIIV